MDKSSKKKSIVKLAANSAALNKVSGGASRKLATALAFVDLIPGTAGLPSLSYIAQGKPFKAFAPVPFKSWYNLSHCLAGTQTDGSGNKLE